LGKTCAHPLYFAQRADQVDGEVRWLVLFLRPVARPADGELFQLVVVVGAVRLVLDQLALVQLVLVVESPTGTPSPSVANWVDVAHLLESGDLRRPVARLADVELPRLVPGFAHRAGGELLRLAAHLDCSARTSCSPAA
jgi:hypothetical protein